MIDWILEYHKGLSIQFLFYNLRRLGATTKSIIFNSLLISVIVTSMTILNGMEACDRNLIKLFKVFGANKIKINDSTNDASTSSVVVFMWIKRLLSRIKFIRVDKT